MKYEAKSEALLGNQNGVKLKDPDIRQEAYRQYCAHIASGYPKEAFCFEHPEFDVCWATMDKYIAENPSEFKPNLMQKAKTKRYKHWFDKGQTLMEGGYKNGSPVVWQTIMRNVFKEHGWDKQEMSVDAETVKGLENALNWFDQKRQERKEEKECQQSQGQ